VCICVCALFQVVQFQPGTDSVPVLVVYSTGLAARPVPVNVGSLRPVATVSPPSNGLLMTQDLFDAFKVRKLAPMPLRTERSRC
jgi:hypothetical protein